MRPNLRAGRGSGSHLLRQLQSKVLSLAPLLAGGIGAVRSWTMIGVDQLRIAAKGIFLGRRVRNGGRGQEKSRNADTSDSKLE